jgi:hypothetical protein
VDGVSVLLAGCIVACLAGGCAVDVKDGVGPRVPVPDVEGTVSRAGSPAVRLDVELADVARDTTLYETRSNRYGFFGFSGVYSGLWEVRVESDVPGDFASVSRQFYRADGDGNFQIRAFDVFAHGASLVAPPAEAQVAVPTPFQPLDFHWSPPNIAGAVAQVQLYDQARQDVWKSGPTQADSVRWYGYGTEGYYQGVPVGPGLYEWRVKFEFPDTSEARTERRRLRLE